MSDERRGEFRRNTLLEGLLKEVNTDLWVAEQVLLARAAHDSLPFPLVLVMGPLRSGTTLFMQWLANTGLVAYPSNFLSRFYGAPVVGAKLQLLLTDPRYRFRDELAGFGDDIAYDSDNGKTRGVLAPNEFWYFWRRFLADPSRDAWADDELRNTLDSNTLLAELGSLMSVFGKPFAMKGMLFNYNIPFLDSLFDKVLFIHLQRDPVANIASALEARIRQSGSESTWYSFRIPEYERLAVLDPLAQVAGQVYCTQRAIRTGLQAVDPARQLAVGYEAFCENPAACFQQLAGRLGLESAVYRGPASFAVSRQVPGPQAARIREAWQSHVQAQG